MARPTTLILISGEAGAGKDTAADMIIAYCGTHCVPAIKVALAGRLKMISQSLIKMFTGVKVPLDDFYDEDKKREIREDMPRFDDQPFSLRTVLQKIGTEVFRDQVSPDIWCDIVRRDYLGAGGVIVISDCRFPNELEYFSRIPNINCLSMRINRPSRVGLAAQNAAHRSETGINVLTVDCDIMNNGSLDDLRDRVIAIVSPLITRHLAMITKKFAA